MKLYFLLPIPFVLAGCLATTNLLKGDGLTPEDAKLVQVIASKIKSTCVTHRSSNEEEDADKHGGAKIAFAPEIKALYKSETGWAKVDIVANGVWDAVYFNPDKKKFVCGQKNWFKLSEFNAASFARVESSPPQKSQ